MLDQAEMQLGSLGDYHFDRYLDVDQQSNQRGATTIHHVLARSPTSVCMLGNDLDEHRSFQERCSEKAA